MTKYEAKIARLRIYLVGPHQPLARDSSADKADISGGLVNGCFAASEVVLGLSISATLEF